MVQVFFFFCGYFLGEGGVCIMNVGNLFSLVVMVGLDFWILFFLRVLSGVDWCRNLI